MSNKKGVCDFCKTTKSWEIVRVRDEVWRLCGECAGRRVKWKEPKPLVASEMRRRPERGGPMSH